MRGLDALLDVADRGSRAGALAGGGLILAAAVLVAVDVTLRKLFSVTTGGADELSGYALAIGSTWSFAFVLMQRGNVRIDALYQHLSLRLAAICDVLALAALLVFGGLVAWYGAGVVGASWQMGARSNSALSVPLVIPQGLWWLGYAWFVVCGVLLMLRGAAALAARDWATAHRRLGARSIEEDAGEELAHAERAQGRAGDGAPA